MALNFEFSLTNAKNLKKVISFEGLEFPILITPTLHGEPLLTVQALYYLSSLESVVRIRFANSESVPKHNSDQELERRFEYIIDNYLFEYSKRYPKEQITSKITDFKYWKNDGDIYLGYDENHTFALALDILNDDSIIEVRNNDFPTKDDWNDWCLISNYTSEYINNYVELMQSLIKKKVSVLTKDNEHLGTGEFELQLLKVNDHILNFYQVEMLEVLQPQRLDEKDGYVLVSRGRASKNDFSLPLEKIIANKYYDAELLSYYFAAIREHLPISKFRCFYNVLEYFFEEAPRELGEEAKNEREQISCVIRSVTAQFSLLKFIKSQGNAFEQNIQIDLVTSSGVKINALAISETNLEKRVAEW